MLGTAVILRVGDMKESLTSKQDNVAKGKTAPKERSNQQIERSDSLDKRSKTSDLARWNTTSNI
jgi:hypothetical protein